MIGIEAAQDLANNTLEARGLDKIVFGDDRAAEFDLNGLPITLSYSSEPCELIWLFVDFGRVRSDPEFLKGILRYGFTAWAAGKMTVALDHDGEHLVGYSAAPAVSLTHEVWARSSTAWSLVRLNCLIDSTITTSTCS